MFTLIICLDFELDLCCPSNKLQNQLDELCYQSRHFRLFSSSPYSCPCLSLSLCFRHLRSSREADLSSCFRFPLCLRLWKQARLVDWLYFCTLEWSLLGLQLRLLPRWRLSERAQNPEWEKLFFFRRVCSVIRSTGPRCLRDGDPWGLLWCWYLVIHFRTWS